MQDLAGLLLCVPVGLRALPTAKCAQRTGGETGAQRQQHAGRPQGVAAEEGEEPRGPGGQELVGGIDRVGQPQPVEVGGRLTQPVVEAPVGAAQDRCAPGQAVGRGAGNWSPSS